MILTTQDLLMIDDARYYGLVKAARANGGTITLSLRPEQSPYAYPQHWLMAADRIEVHDARGVTVAVLKDRDGLTYDNRSPT